MSSILTGTREFETAVYGTVFGRRTDVLHRLRVGDRLILVPDPPGTDEPNVWVHAPGGDVIGHLSPTSTPGSSLDARGRPLRRGRHPRRGRRGREL
jgi:hypothetical protein